MASGILIVLYGVVVVVPVRFVERALSVPRSRFVTVKSIRQFGSVLSFWGRLINISAPPATGLKRLEAKTKGLTTGFL